MKLIITIGILTDEAYTEHNRGTIDIPENAMISVVLEEAKTHIAPLSPILTSPHILRHLYLMHPDTREKLEETKSVVDYGLKEGSILYLMSGVR